MNSTICPGICEPFVAHVNHKTLMSEKISPLDRVRTLPTMNTHRKVLRNPKFKVSKRVPYVTIGELFAARKPNVSCPFFHLVLEGGIMLTSAPVSPRKRSQD